MEIYNKVAVAGSIMFTESESRSEEVKGIHEAITKLGLDSYWFDDEETLLEVFGIRPVINSEVELRVALAPALSLVESADFILTPEYIFDVTENNIRRLSYNEGHWKIEGGRIILETEYSELDHYRTALYNYACFDLNDAAESSYVYERLSETGRLSDSEIIDLGLGYLVKESA